jgi:ectoine hydroxylase-related dioxygenase (phytanoyl-CoA dioxygenase family)
VKRIVSPLAILAPTVCFERMRELEIHGGATIAAKVEPALLAALGENVFTAGAAGTRDLLDDACVATVATSLGSQLIGLGVLTPDAIAVQAIAFDKTPAANWKVTWHQDVMFPFAKRVQAAGYDLPSAKDGVAYARPPRAVLERMLAARLHLDDCDADNGPLRVAPGSHRHGVFTSTEIPERVRQHGETSCFACAGEVLLMRPLLLHASSPAREPRRRRVLHIVYYAGPPATERWHRELAVGHPISRVELQSPG